MVRHRRFPALWIGVIGILSGLALFLHAPHAAANPDSYPYADVPCVWAPYTTHGRGARWCANYDWGTRPDNARPASVISPYGYAYRNCTDYVAWKLDSLGVPATIYRGLHHAKDWATPPADRGIVVDGVPAVGSVAVRTTGEYGHLAFVEAVAADGSIYISQYNRHADGVYSEDSGQPALLGFSLFIHMEAYMPSQAVAEPVIEPAAEEVPQQATVSEAEPDPELAPAPTVSLLSTETTGGTVTLQQVSSEPVRPPIPDVPIAAGVTEVQPDNLPRQAETPVIPVATPPPVITAPAVSTGPVPVPSVPASATPSPSAHDPPPAPSTALSYEPAVAPAAYMAPRATPSAWASWWPLGVFLAAVGLREGVRAWVRRKTVPVDARPHSA